MKMNRALLLSIALFFQKDLIGEDGNSPLLEAKAGYFFFASAQMTEVYPNGGFELQLCGSYPLYKCLQIYASAGYLQAWGKSDSGKQSTTIWQIPVDLGLKSIFDLTSCVQYYLGLGPRYFYLHQHNNSSYVDNNVSYNGIGLFANMGFNFFPTCHFFVDLFGEYAYEPAHFSSSKPEVSGGAVQMSIFTFGAGLGVAF